MCSLSRLEWVNVSMLLMEPVTSSAFKQCPVPRSEAPVSKTKTLLEEGWCKTGHCMWSSLTFSKAFWHCSVHLNATLGLVSWCKAATSTEKFGMKQSQNWAIPKNVRRALAVVGVGNSLWLVFYCDLARSSSVSKCVQDMVVLSGKICALMHSRWIQSLLLTAELEQHYLCVHQMFLLWYLHHHKMVLRHSQPDREMSYP